MRDHLHLSPGTLGFVLLAIACGSLLALPLSGTIITHFGSRRTIVAMALLTGAALAIVAVGYLTDVLVVVVGLFAFGFSAGAWDVAMNVQAAIVERRLERSIMPRFHAGFSIGTVGGALVGAAMVALGVSVTLHLAVVAAVIAIGVPFAVRAFIADHHETHTSSVEPVEGESRGAAARRSAFSRWSEPRTLLIGLFVLSFAFAEGAGNDWISVAIIDGYDTRAVVGTLGFAVFLTAMTAGRWFGPYVLDRYEQVVVIRLLALLGIGGALLFVYGSSTPLAFVGAALWGIGASLGFPLGMTAAAADPAAAAGRVSVVASIGYCAFLIGPPFIGFLGDQITVIRALTTVAGLLTLAAVTASSLRVPASARNEAAPGA